MAYSVRLSPNGTGSNSLKRGVFSGISQEQFFPPQALGGETTWSPQLAENHHPWLSLANFTEFAPSVARRHPVFR
jgi:hypothetical protein